MTITLDDVLTHAQLDDYVGGQLIAQQHLAPTGDTDTVKARTWALGEVLAVLAGRTPPVYESMVSAPSELRRAVRHKAAERLYFLAMSSSDQGAVYHAKWKAEQGYASTALAQLKPTLGDGVQATATSIGISRR